MPKKNRQTPPVHPGEILREDLMKPLGLSVNGLARELKVPVTRISEIVNGRRGLNADTSLRLSRYFGSTPEFGINLQIAYDSALPSTHPSIRGSAASFFNPLRKAFRRAPSIFRNIYMPS
jgi:addiction module HigA family antidote